MGTSELTFGQWLTDVVRLHPPGVVSYAGPRQRVGTWSERLAVAMEKGREFDSHLRQLAKGERHPNPETTYNIGRGLHAAGLGWCSGSLALLRNPATFKDALAVVDIASRAENPHNIVAGWYFLASAKVFELPGSGLDAEGTAVVLDLLTRLTSNIASAMDSAFAEYQKRGLRASYGLLGDAYFIGSDKRLSRPADIAAFAIKQWLVENKFDNDFFLSQVAKSLKTGSVTQSPSTNTQLKKAD